MQQHANWWVDGRNTTKADMMINRLAMYMPSTTFGNLDMGEREILQVAVARIEEQQKNVVDKLEDLSALITETKQRVTVIEEFKWKVVGICLAVGVISSILVPIVKLILSKI